MVRSVKRSTPLGRGKPLRRDGAGARRFAASRRKPLPAKSVRRAAQRDHELAVTEQVFRRDGGCILSHLASHRCHGTLTPHHLRKQSAGGQWTLENCVALCAGANGMVEDEPGWARTIGLVVRAGLSPAEAWQRRVDNGLIVRGPQP